MSRFARGSLDVVGACLLIIGVAISQASAGATGGKAAAVHGAKAPVEPAPAPAPDAAPVAPIDAAPAPADVARSRAAFLDVARVLQSPRCQNCHPIGDAPHVGDAGRPHPQNVSRKIESLGMRCATCHQDENRPRPGPPGAPKWGMPPAATPMIFEGRTPAALCRQLRDPAQNGGRDLAALLHHVAEDPLVGWGWAPGEGRTLPPLSRETVVAAMRTWIDGGAACPEEAAATETPPAPAAATQTPTPSPPAAPRAPSKEAPR